MRLFQQQGFGGSSNSSLRAASMGGQQGSSDFEAAGIREQQRLDRSRDFAAAAIWGQLRCGGSMDLGAAVIWWQQRFGESKELAAAGSWGQQGCAARGRADND